MAVSDFLSPLRVPVSSSGLLKTGRPSRMPTRERSAPTSAWSCRPCPQDCAPSALATLRPKPPPPGRVCAECQPRSLGDCHFGAAVRFAQIAACIVHPPLFDSVLSDKQLCDQNEKLICGFGCCPLRNWHFTQRTRFEGAPTSGVPESVPLKARQCL
jgi:hypothetical protein